jgi:hypothetical protein
LNWRGSFIEKEPEEEEKEEIEGEIKLYGWVL